jgi:hypothetical protein
MMDSEMLNKLDAAVDQFSGKWSGMFHRCAHCGAEVPAADVRQQFAAELKPLLIDAIEALFSDAGAPGTIDAEFVYGETDADKAERDALTAAQLAGATVEALATMEHPESEADKIERDALTSAAIATEEEKPALSDPPPAEAKVE